MNSWEETRRPYFALRVISGKQGLRREGKTGVYEYVYEYGKREGEKADWKAPYSYTYSYTQISSCRLLTACLPCVVVT